MWAAAGAALVLLGIVAWALGPRRSRSNGVLDAIERLERELRDEVARSATGTRQELLQQLATVQQTMLAQGGEAVRTQNEQIDTFRTQLERTQQVLTQQAQTLRESQDTALMRASEQQSTTLRSFDLSMADRLRTLTEGNERKLTEVRSTVEAKLTLLAQGNEAKLEQMRATVDEKLHATLEQRLGESFKLVADRLDAVHNGLGEMKKLATDVGSLNRVLTNVKSRGIFGEVQLGSLLEQVLTTEQYARNVETVPGSNARVEYAIRLPGQRTDGSTLWLPIDAKFPREDYERLLDAQDRADAVQADAAGKALEGRLRDEAKTIRDKYIAAPHTTDFAILFVPTEGLYAEALRRPGLSESLQRDCHVMIAGPTTLLATLNSLQMGFRTLALEQRSAEVWEVLGAVKTEFGKFGDILKKTKEKLDQASRNIETAETRSRAMVRQLRTVEALPDSRTRELLVDAAFADGEEKDG